VGSQKDPKYGEGISAKALFQERAQPYAAKIFRRPQSAVRSGFRRADGNAGRAIYEAWLKLPDDVRKEMEQDFQDIDELATEGGSKAIRDEARWHGENLAEQFASLIGFHERAFWTFLERPKYWQGALAFHHADGVFFSYWCRLWHRTQGTNQRR
jgi:hypothetical protein